jgi:hypothetical protein
MTETRIGTLTFEKGFPSEDTTRRVFDELDYQRAVPTFLWASISRMSDRQRSQSLCIENTNR